MQPILMDMSVDDSSGDGDDYSGDIHSSLGMTLFSWCLLLKT